MSDQTVNEECLELLDAMEIGFELSDYEQSIEELAEEIFKQQFFNDDIATEVANRKSQCIRAGFVLLLFKVLLVG